MSIRRKAEFIDHHQHPLKPTIWISAFTVCPISTSRRRFVAQRCIYKIVSHTKTTITSLFALNNFSGEITWRRDCLICCSKKTVVLLRVSTWVALPLGFLCAVKDTDYKLKLLFCCFTVMCSCSFLQSHLLLHTVVAFSMKSCSSIFQENLFINHTTFHGNCATNNQATSQ